MLISDTAGEGAGLAGSTARPCGPSCTPTAEEGTAGQRDQTFAPRVRRSAQCMFLHDAGFLSTRLQFQGGGAPSGGYKRWI